MNRRYIKQWSQRYETRFAEAIAAISDDMRDNETSFNGSLSHYANLFEIDEEALRHEWNLRNEDVR